MKFRRSYLLLILAGFVICLIPLRAKIRSRAVGMFQTLKGKRSVSDRVAEFADAVHKRLAKRFEEIGVRYPAKSMILVGLKQERALEVWMSNGTSEFFHLKTYPILAASGTLGPKLAEGDKQVPEGIYRIASLNPNSLFHLALRVDFPNSFDQAKARLDGRSNLGTDIMIHGKASSIGCLAMGDEASEDLFVLAAETGLENISVIVSPLDFRVRHPPSGLANSPTWLPELYADIEKELLKLTRSEITSPHK